MYRKFPKRPVKQLVTLHTQRKEENEGESGYVASIANKEFN